MPPGATLKHIDSIGILVVWGKYDVIKSDLMANRTRLDKELYGHT
jgi:hypothetical protein